MKRFVYSCLVGGGLMLAGSITAFAHNGVDHTKDGDKPAAAAAADKTVTLVGEVIDTACFTASDGDAKGKDHAECAQKCMATGIPAGILPEGKAAGDALVLLTNPKVFAPFAAQMIKVEGTAYPAKHAFDVKKAFVKDGQGWKEIQLDDEHHKMTGGDAKAAGTGGAHAPATKPAGDGHTGHAH